MFDGEPQRVDFAVEQRELGADFGQLIVRRREHLSDRHADECGDVAGAVGAMMRLQRVEFLLRYADGKHFGLDSVVKHFSSIVRAG